MNLCTNAIHALGNKGTLSVSLASVSLSPKTVEDKMGINPGEYISIVISDTGHGIPENIAFDHIVMHQTVNDKRAFALGGAEHG